MAGRAHRAPAPAGAGRHGPGGCRAGRRPVGVPSRQATGGRARSGPYPAAHPGRRRSTGRCWGGGRRRHHHLRDRGTRHGRGRGHVLDPRRWAAGLGRGGGVPVAVPAHPHRDPRARRPGTRRGARRGRHPPARLGAANTHADPEANRRPGRDGSPGPPCRARAAWLALWGPDLATAQDDLVAALHAAAAEVEDRHGVSVELVTVGTCRLDERARAVVGAASEALTNAAKHAGVTRVSVFVEVADGQVVVVVRDRGRGFDQAAAGKPGGGRGIPDSILGRIRRHGGAAAIRTAPGAGTEVELRMPAART